MRPTPFDRLFAMRESWDRSRERRIAKLRRDVVGLVALLAMDCGCICFLFTAPAIAWGIAQATGAESINDTLEAALPWAAGLGVLVFAGVALAFSLNE